MQLKLNKYQVRSERGILRFMLMLSMAYVFCNCFYEATTFGNKRLEAQKEIHRCLIDEVYAMADSGVSPDEAYYRLNAV